MSNATEIYPIRGSNNPETEIVGLTIVYDGSGVPSVLTGRGIVSVNDDGTGLFTIKTAFQWTYLVGAGQIPYLISSAKGLSAQIVAKDSAARTIQIRVVGDADAAEDPANTEGICLLLMFQKSGAAVK